MTTFSNAPRLLKGGLALLDPEKGTVLKILPLQYNPDSLQRTLQIRGIGAESGDQVEAMRLKGPPAESIKLEVEIDATDQLEVADGQVTQAGLHHVLAALETIVYPTSTHLIANNVQASSGSIEIIPAEASLTVFIFGPKRIVPVRITELSITEEAFDTALNPIRAKVSLGMRVLSVDDVGFDQKAGNLFMTYLQGKETLAASNLPGAFGQLGITGL